MTFTNDELILILISLVRATRPRMLRQEADGFSVDFEPLAGKKTLDDDDRLLLKLRSALEPPAAPDLPASPDLRSNIDSPSNNDARLPASEPPSKIQSLSLELDGAESRRLASTLARLEEVQPWPADVLAMSRDLRTRLLRAVTQ